MYQNCSGLCIKQGDESGAAEGNQKWGVKERAFMASAGARAYNWGLGAEPPAGVQSPWSAFCF